MSVLLHALGLAAVILGLWVLGSFAMLGLWIAVVTIGGHLGDEDSDE